VLSDTLTLPRQSPDPLTAPPLPHQSPDQSTAPPLPHQSLDPPLDRPHPLDGPRDPLWIREIHHHMNLPRNVEHLRVPGASGEGVPCAGASGANGGCA